MTIFTSSYVAHRRIVDPIGIGISASTPHWFRGQVYKKVAPSWELLRAYKNKSIDFDGYTEQYLDYLHSNNVTPEMIISDLKKYGDPVVLLCWEKERDLCHRGILAELLMLSGNDPIYEYTV